MSDTISVVKGDSVSNLTVSLVREDNGLAFSVGNGGSIKLRIRKTGTTSPILGEIDNDATLTAVSGDFVFPLGGTNFLGKTAVVDGYYEGVPFFTYWLSIASKDGYEKKQKSGPKQGYRKWFDDFMSRTPVAKLEELLTK